MFLSAFKIVALHLDRSDAHRRYLTVENCYWNVSGYTNNGPGPRTPQLVEQPL
jgi:hypothetical protein